jgi:hypothetical protein
VLHASWRRGSRAGILIWIFSPLGEIGVEVQDFKHGLGITLIVLLGDCGRVQQLRPFGRQADKLAGLRIEANVDRVGKVGRVAHTSHARACAVDEVDPFVEVIITLHPDL